MNPEWSSRAWVQTALDVGLSLVAVLVLWLVVPAPTAAFRALQFALGLTAVAGVGIRRRWPAGGFALACGATAVAWSFGLTDDPFVLAGAALYSVAVKRGGRVLSPWTGISLVFGISMAAMVSATGFEDAIQYVLLSGIVLTGAWALGVNIGKSKKLTAANATLHERARMARDVHDVLSHSLGTIGIRAGVAGFVQTLTEAQLRDALREIEQMSRSSMDELKELLIATNDRGTGPVSGSRLEGLLGDTAAMARGAGLEVTTEVSGAAGLSNGIGVAVHRMVREAVTNAVRHARATHCVVQVMATNEHVAVTVTDNGAGMAAEAGEGFGLTGIRQRVSLLGGTVAAGNLDSGGFRLAVHLPITTEAGEHPNA